MKRLTRHYSAIASTLALIVALTGVGAATAGKLHLISGKHIKNNSISGAKVKNNSISGAKVSFPAATPIGPGGAKAAAVQAAKSVGDQFALVAEMGAYTKADPASVLQISWTGTVGSPTGAPCIFQLRIDGKPPSGGGGEVYTNTGGQSIAVQSLFSGIALGARQVQVFARSLPTASGATDSPCVVSPPETQIPQTVNAVELVN
jgi:hypothetical protein